MHSMKIIAVAALSAVCAFAAAGAHAADAAQMPTIDRAAKGDITLQGGARRLSGDQTELLRASLVNRQAKNVILLIGDGMGDSEITAARNFAYGAAGAFPGLDALPVTGQYTHYSLDRKTHKPDYVTDSAASATAWNTGVKSYNGAIGVDVFGKPQTSIFELAKRAGKATGNVSTAEIQDATPAAVFAHVTHRKCYGPESTTLKCPKEAAEAGGPGSITEQLIRARADVTLGGGMASFREAAKGGEFAGKTLIDAAREAGYRIVTNTKEMEAVDAADQKQPLLGLFSEGNMPVRLKGPKASLDGNIKLAPVVCEKNSERTAEHPTLAQMTRKAIELLAVNPKGFFLQVEGASIDKQDHKANPCGQFGETVDLDEAVQVALDFAKKDGNTLVVVTADHAHACQIIYPKAEAPGLSLAVMTKDGAPMTVTYGNNDDPENQGHTGTQLRIAAYGPHAANVSGLTDQTDLYFTILSALGLEAKK